MNDLFSVRRLIWSWQIIEAVLLIALFRQSQVSLMMVLLLTLVTMVLLRGIIVGIIAVTVSVSFASTTITKMQFLRFWWGEFVAFCYLYFWAQAKPRKTLDPHPPVLQRHVIFVHGFLCNDGFWIQLGRQLQRAGVSFSSVEMSAAFASIETFARLVENEIEHCLARNSNASITLIAFSMGGLACRRLPDGLQKNVNLITLYTPHQGTLLANITGFFGAANGREMAKGSDWLATLNQQPDQFKKAVGIWSTHDTIVMPSVLGKPPFHALRLRGRGHLNASIDRRLHRHLIRLLKVL
ncbi:triacylglycerol lipase [Reinekea sp. G2M2-21]|uniref:esterase/lipase family protein n=1 Tax=Reinekea sp. G2M2-21 TaxID=2788942 RepID=UPI0018A93A89|nr:hypothetical protein [Reinekea sp. G2M2-21]